MIRVLIAEDNEVVRKGIAGVLERHSGLIVVGQAENGAVALELLRSGLHADVLLTDLNMPCIDGLELIRHIRKLDLAISCIILTMHANSAFRDKALNAGAKGYLLKNGDVEELVSCIRDVYKGLVVIGHEV